MRGIEIDFEEVSRMFEDYHKTGSISHCDMIIVEKDKIRAIEKTVYINKNLVDRNIYQNELAELVKKMWGTYAILIWYLDNETLKGKRNFVLEVKISKNFERLLGKILIDLKKFKNGSFDDINIDFEVV